jgi:hypothetical protein
MLGREENTMQDSGAGFGSGERRANEIARVAGLRLGPSPAIGD